MAGFFLLPPVDYRDYYEYHMDHVPLVLPTFVRLRVVDFLEWLHQNNMIFVKWFAMYLPLILCILIAIAFTTLLERKIMGSVQRRVGPNVVGVLGLFQAIADGLKLLSKEPLFPRKANKVLFIGAPFWAFFMSLMTWFFVPLCSVPLVDFELGLLYLMVINVFEVYGVLIAGWASNSKYALLGGLRAAAQMISYELGISFIFVTIVLVTGSFNLVEIVRAQECIWFVFPLFPLAVLFLIGMLAETNRTPFDLPEAEAELVAGYNVEYSGFLFALFFLGEYSNMLFLSVLFTLLFLGGWTWGTVGMVSPIVGVLMLSTKAVLVLSGFIWVRATLPRYRYDQLMNLGWKVFLPGSFGFFVFYLVLSYWVGVLPAFYDVFPFYVWGRLFA